MMGDMKFTTAEDMVKQQPYEISISKDNIEIYFFGKFHSKYDFVDHARLVCDVLNQVFEEKISILTKAFSEYNNSPRGWTHEARMERALDTIYQNGWDLTKQ